MNFYIKAIMFLLVIGIFQYKFTGNIYAASGCCSGHGGVNCGAGSQSNGKVICNDGSRTSNCLYSEMKICAPVKEKTIKTPVVKIAKPTKVPVKKIEKPMKVTKPVMLKVNKIKK